MAKHYYVDTSAYLCVLLGEKGFELVQRELSGAYLVSSVLLVLEVNRSLVRLSREGIISPSEFHEFLVQMNDEMEHFMLRDLTFDLCISRSMPVISTPRSLDLAHLRTALWFHEQTPLTRFVTLDDAQAQAAREMALPV